MVGEGLSRPAGPGIEGLRGVTGLGGGRAERDGEKRVGGTAR